VRNIVEQLGLYWDEAFAAFPAQIEASIRSGRPAPFEAAAVAANVYATRPPAELLA
jgi:hypothetical protein